jgi:SAM-dependent methyltransferase
VIECPLCAARTHEPWRTHGARELVRCGECGLVYVNALPDPASHHRQVGESLVYTDDQLAKRPFFRRRAHELLESIEGRQGRPGRLLDLGCGIGTELEVAIERGWSATGIELATGSLRVAREQGLDVIDRPLAQAELPDASFDLVTVNHALEHMPRVRPVLADVRRVLKPGGVLFVSVPNLEAWQHRTRLDRFGLAFNDDHYLFFTPATLNRLLGSSGFDVIEMKTSRFLDFQAPLKEFPAAFRAVNDWFEGLGLGIEIFALAKAA